ncbi:MAG: DUF456 domain-containing protein [Anaerolineae bacterium]|nr:DUF456 domain-containing protein [Anaerolineae bacterium]MDK1082190.1 DUF456 domain-containing protein [Anaerolineae bacterium]
MPFGLEFWFKVGVDGVTLFVLIVGTAGLIIPVFPGLIVNWLAFLFYGAATGFDTKGWIIFILATILMIIGNVSDNIMMGKKARESGASWFSIGTGYIASIGISIFFTPLAGLAAAPVSVFLIELIRQRKIGKALRVAWSLMVGWGWSIAIRITIGVVMIGLWMIWAWT